MTADKKAQTYRLSSLARAVLARLAASAGVSRTDMLETLLRAEGERIGMLARVNGALVDVVSTLTRGES